MERFSDDQIREIVRSRIAVTRQNVALMKSLLLAHFNSSTTQMIDIAVRGIGFERPSRLLLDGGTESRGGVEKLGDYYSWVFCAIQALWELIHAGVLLPATSQTLTTVSMSVQVHHAYGGHSRSIGGVDFMKQDEVPFFPATVIKTRCEPEGFVLSDPDLYLDSLRPHVVHVEVAEALQEAVKCFRSELYMATVVMLGKASEGVWIEVGKALIDALPKADQAKSSKFRADLDSANVGFARKLRDITKHYESKQAEYAAIAKDTRLSLDDFRLAAIWSDGVRDSRNIVHYGIQPNIPTNYQNVATLLLAGSTHLRNLYALYKAALAHPGA